MSYAANQIILLPLSIDICCRFHWFLSMLFLQDAFFYFFILTFIALFDSRLIVLIFFFQVSYKLEKNILVYFV